MNRSQDPIRFRAIPEAHIQIIKRRDDQGEGLDAGPTRFKSNQPIVRRASLAQEVKDGNLALPTLLKDPDTILNMEKGRTSLSTH